MERFQSLSIAITMNGHMTDSLSCFLQNLSRNLTRAAVPDTTRRSDNVSALPNHKEDKPFGFDELMFMLTAYTTKKVRCANNRHIEKKINDKIWVWLVLCNCSNAYSFCVLSILLLTACAHMYASLSSLVSLYFSPLCCCSPVAILFSSKINALYSSHTRFVTLKHNNREWDLFRIGDTLL